MRARIAERQIAEANITIGADPQQLPSALRCRRVGTEVPKSSDRVRVDEPKVHFVSYGCCPR